MESRESEAFCFYKEVKVRDASDKKMPYIFPSASTEKSIGHFLCCFATENPRASGEKLLYFLVGVSPFAFSEAVVLRKRRINGADLARTVPWLRHSQALLRKPCLGLFESQ